MQCVSRRNEKLLKLQLMGLCAVFLCLLNKHGIFNLRPYMSDELRISRMQYSSHIYKYIRMRR
jgi:hypothetical protein